MFGSGGNGSSKRSRKENGEVVSLLPVPHGGAKYGSLRHSTGGALSVSSFKLISKELDRQKRERPHSVTGSEPDEELLRMRSYGRRTLYGSLPFVAAFGMSKREDTIRKVLFSVNMMTDFERRPNFIEGEDVDLDKILVTFPLIMATLVAMVSQFLLGYNTSVMNAPAAVVFPDHTTAQWSLAVSTFAIGGPIGAMLGGTIATALGRRSTMMLNNMLFLIGGVIMTLAPTVYWLIPARFLIGFASGISSVVVPIYLGEIAPPTLRGTLGTCTQFASAAGIFATSVVAFPLATPLRWRYMFAVTPLLCVAQFLVSRYLLESPRWLLAQDEASEEARHVIRELRGYRTTREVEDEVQNFLFASSKHEEESDGEESDNGMDTFRQDRIPFPSRKSAPDRQQAKKPSVMWSLLTTVEMRPLLMSAIVLQLGQQLCGINAVFYYSTSFFDGVISSPVMGTFLVGFLNVLATYAALLLMDDTGRRTLILISSGGMIVCTALIMTALLGYTYKIVAAMAVMGFVSFFEIGLGPIPWLIVAEMFDTKYVAPAMSLSCVVNWICNFLVGFFFPFMQNILGPWSFGPFGIVLVLVFLYTFFFLVETQGRSVEEVQLLAQAHAEEVEKMRSGSLTEFQLRQSTAYLDSSSSAQPPSQVGMHNQQQQQQQADSLRDDRATSTTTAKIVAAKRSSVAALPPTF